MNNRNDKGFGNAGIGPVRTVDRQILLMTGLSLAIALVLASLYPPPLTMAVFSGLLMLASIATVLTAMLLWQRPRLNSLNLWDKAAILAFVSLGAGMFVDPDATRAFIEARSADVVAPAADPAPSDQS